MHTYISALTLKGRCRYAHGWVHFQALKWDIPRRRLKTIGATFSEFARKCENYAKSGFTSTRQDDDEYFGDDESYSTLDEDGNPIFISRDDSKQQASAPQARTANTSESSYIPPRRLTSEEIIVAEETYTATQRWFRGVPPRRSPPQTADKPKQQEHMEMLDI